MVEQRNSEADAPRNRGIRAYCRSDDYRCRAIGQKSAWMRKNKECEVLFHLEVCETMWKFRYILLQYRRFGLLVQLCNAAI
jgi:hypothetical protein